MLIQKLLLYQNNIRKLHSSSQIGLYTFSNIITTKGFNYGANGLDIPQGYIIFRSIDDALISYLRLGILENPIIEIKGTSYKIESVKSVNNNLDLNRNDIEFKSISPVLVRNFKDKKLYLSNEGEVSDNLNLLAYHQLKNYFGIPNPKVTFEDLKVQKKTIRISSNGKKESITTGFNLHGRIRGTPDALSLLYYRGLGSKTSLGLGCWEEI
ncbi:CRISPR-associated endoribonuclease Cas6 [Acidiplasma cupricumulans]|uniref:CRISPR-associated endoribonuclease Cas6 n=1 Tax=Acidiplasma cupricumulans TaxID=312540 RepID=UPI0015847E07|nr:CRISPR-associated endoribonuclease Cas6 [Acidiplasma cupricumulans]